MFKLDRHIYEPTHGPQTWPWWKLLSIRIVRCTHDPAHFFWITPISYNCWFYTRWGAACLNIRERRGIYRATDYQTT